MKDIKDIEIIKETKDTKDTNSQGKVAILHFTCPPVVGGVEIIMGAHAELLARAGYEVTIVTGRGPLPDYKNPRLTAKLEPLVDSKNARLLALNAELDAGRVPADFAAYEQELFEKLANTLSGHEVCIVHNAFTLYKNLPLTAALLRLVESKPEVRFVAWCHDLAWTNPLYAATLYEREPWTLLKKSSPQITYVAISPQRQAEIVQSFVPPLEPSQVPIVPNGVALLDFLKIGGETQTILAAAELHPRPPNNALFLIPARVTRRKNIELAIKVARALKDDGFAAKMIITGPPGPHNPKNDEYVRELWELRERLGVEQEVIFLMEKWQDGDGRPRTLADEVIADLYRYCDALLFPSSQEGFGIPILEAGLLNLPIFATALAPIKEVAGDLINYFEPDSNPAQVATLIQQQLAKNKQYQLRREILKKYTWEAIFEQQILPLVGK